MTTVARTSTRTRSGRWVGGALFCGATAVLLAACAPDAPATSTPVVWPAGTVLALNSTPISADEVDAVASIVARLQPQRTLPYLRRMALTNVVLPRVAAREVFGPGRQSALAAAEAWRAALERDEAPPAPLATPESEIAEGGYEATGMEVWNWALDCPLGVWSEPIETVGSWRLARVLERGAGRWPTDVVLKLDMRTFPWSDSETLVQDVEQQLDHSKLTFVDEDWRDLVPTAWQRRLRGSS
jgi:hypothetical protein